jgi:hypothetical protein
MFRKLLWFVVIVVLAHALTVSPGAADAFALVMIPAEFWVIFRAWPACRSDVKSALTFLARFRPHRRGATVKGF